MFKIPLQCQAVCMLPNTLEIGYCSFIIGYLFYFVVSHFNFLTAAGRRPKDGFSFEKHCSADGFSFSSSVRRLKADGKGYFQP